MTMIDQTFPSPKITNITGNVQQDDNFMTNDLCSSDADVSVWEDEQNNDNTDTEQKFKCEVSNSNFIIIYV